MQAAWEKRRSLSTGWSSNLLERRYRPLDGRVHSVTLASCWAVRNNTLRYNLFEYSRQVYRESQGTAASIRPGAYQCPCWQGCIQRVISNPRLRHKVKTKDCTFLMWRWGRPPLDFLTQQLIENAGRKRVGETKQYIQNQEEKPSSSCTVLPNAILIKFSIVLIKRRNACTIHYNSRYWRINSKPKHMRLITDIEGFLVYLVFLCSLLF